MSLSDNYRRDLTGKVAELAKIPEIDGKLEKTTDPKTFNLRFKSITTSLRSLFDAVADLASRDKKYLQSFFQGYVNPVYVKSYRYTDKNAYVQSTTFQSNGVPLTFPETRIFYDHNGYGVYSEVEGYPIVFKNGKLLSESNYSLYNTAYGLKLFVKSTAVANNDEITLTINKKFNSVIGGWNYPNTTIKTSLTTTIPISLINTGNFYHIKHLKLYIRKDGRTFYSPMADNLYTITDDVSGTSIRLYVNTHLVVGDRLQILNTTSFWYNSTTFTTGTETCCTNPTIPLVDSVTNLPVPFVSTKDFDVFYDDVRLIPDKHFSIIPSLDSYSPDELVFLFDSLPNTTHTVKIYKNEPYYEDDSILINKQTLNVKGLELIPDTKRFPVMPKLGAMFISGRFYDSLNRLNNKHRRVLEVQNVDSLTDFYYLMKIVATQELDELLIQLQSVSSEMDLVIELLGFDTVVSNIYSSLDSLAVTNTDTIDSALSISGYNPQITSWLMFYKYIQYQKQYSNADIIIDNNLEVPGFFTSINGGLDLNANACSCNDIELNSNLTF